MTRDYPPTRRIKAEERAHLREGEIAVLELLAEGCTRSEIAAILGIARATVSDRLEEAYRVMKARNSVHAAVLWATRGAGQYEGGGE